MLINLHCRTIPREAEDIPHTVALTVTNQNIGDDPSNRINRNGTLVFYTLSEIGVTSSPHLASFEQNGARVPCQMVPELKLPSSLIDSHDLKPHLLV